MREKIFRVIWGVILGFILVGLLYFILGFQSIGSSGHNSNTQNSSQDTTSSETDSLTEIDSITENGSDTESEMEYTTETETEIPTEVDDPNQTNTETETETDTEKEPEKEPEKPVEIPYLIKVNRVANCVTVYGKDANGAYTIPVKSMICSVGLFDENGKSDTPIGTFKTTDKYVWRKLFGEIDIWGNYTTRITGHILFHSVPYTVTGINAGTEKTMWEGQYNKLGEPASQGCIRLTVADAKWIYDNCPSGTTVTIYDDAENPGPLGRPEAIKIHDESPFAAWDPTDPNLKNPWHTGSVVIKVNGKEEPTAEDNFTIERGEKVNLLENIVATDVDTMPLELQIETDLNVSVPGTYNVVYTATGVTGKTDTMTLQVIVKDTVAPEIGFANANKDTVEIDDSFTVADVENAIKNILSAIDKYILEVTVEVEAPGTQTPADTQNPGDTQNPESTESEPEKIEVIEKVERKDVLSHEYIHIDLTEIKTALENKAYGDYVCKVYATDASGNQSGTIQVKVAYLKRDCQEPTVTITETKPTATVDLTGVTEEGKRQKAMLNAAIAAIKKGVHYTVSDDMTPEENIKCTVVGAYTGPTNGGEQVVELIIIATDAVGKKTATEIQVTVVVTDAAEETPTETEESTSTEEASSTEGTVSTEETSATEGQSVTEEPASTEGRSVTEEPSSL